MGARAARDRRADTADHLVADGVAVLEVEVAEAVDVDHRHAQRPAMALGALDVELELGAEGAQGQQAAGDLITRSEPGQLGLELGNPTPSDGQLGGEVVALSRCKHRCRYRRREPPA